MNDLQEKSTNTLALCPFCGGEYAQVRYMGGNWQEPSAFCSGYRGECCDCGAITAAYATEAEAIDAWNTRVDYHGYEQAAIEAWESIKAWNTRAERTCRIVKTWSDSDYVDGWRYRCSECGCFIPVNECDQETGNVISAANYCPNCGRRCVYEST